MANSITTAQKWIKNADAILVTASNGFSISEGLNLFANDQKLHEVLGDLTDKYNIPNFLTAFGYNYSNELDRWRAYGRITEYYSHNYHPGKLMSSLKKIIGDKPYYIWTSNTDHHFALAGFNNIFEIEGNWLNGICRAHPKEHGITNLQDKLHNIYSKDQQGTLENDDIPKCDQCGEPLSLNLASENFQIDQNQLEGFSSFVQKYQMDNILVLELGIGPNNQMIKGPSTQLIAATEKSRYITINKGQVSIPDIISERSIGFSSSIDDAFESLLTGKDLGLKITGPKGPQPELSPTQQQEQTEFLKQIFPSYMIERGIRPSELSMYMTIDTEHLSHLHLLEQGQAWMYSLGNSALVHCFTKDGKYYQVKLGLDKSKKQVHGFYIEPGTAVAFEDLNDNGAGFSQLNGSIPSNSSGQVLIPKKDALIEMFPGQADVINRLSID
ncbi:cupin domain-containing protein [Companilactobacillus furfuricola]|uniref:cupin domain-containing protein n=1 Tax=Companilactobacillus furfuricola TaxID=1462575 RepID=UPI000F7B3E19|nr:cupin domain-containing protein [Companilactobacillus furfuricola]